MSDLSGGEQAKPSAPKNALARGIIRMDDAIYRVVELIAAALLVVEIIVLFCGIFTRYVLDAPLVWTDEFASLLFIWLGMLGTIVAVRRAAHLRMMTFVNMMPKHLQIYAEPLAVATTLAFFLFMFPAAVAHVQTEYIVITPTLGISNAWRALAMPVCNVLLIYTVLARMVEQPMKPMLIALGVVAGIIIVLIALQPVFPPLGRGNLLIFFALLVPIMVFAGIPIAFAFGIGTMTYLGLSTYVPLSVLVARVDAGMSHTILLSIPLFVFLGVLIEMTGMAEVMVKFLANMLGHVRGGLQYALVAAMYLVSGISGSKAADMAAIAPALFPQMEKLGADRAEMTALLAATGAQTETVPPSLILIAVGSVTGVSIAALFTAGLLPAALLGLMLCVIIWRRSRRDDTKTKLLPKASRSVIWKSFIIAIPALILPFLIRASVLEGVATATEVSTIGIAYSFVLGLFFYRRFDWSKLFPMLTATVSLSGAILFVVGAATAMAWAITQSGFSQSLAAAIAQVPGGIFSFLTISVVLFAILGSILEGLPAIVLFAPLLFPIARDVGVNEVHYAIVAILSMSLGLFAPPFGIGFYITCAIAGASPEETMPHIWQYLFWLTIGVIIIAAIPWISIGFL